jgi:CRISPR-associated protein Cmr4
MIMAEKRLSQRIFETRLLILLAETPVHAGSGAELGAVDLPIQRERHTRYPTIHGSGVKGVLRDLCERQNGEKARITEVLFGSPPPAGAGGEALDAGSLVVGDARLLLLPVRSAGNVFAWVTCPYALRRLERDLASIDGAGDAIRKALESASVEGKGLVPSAFPLSKALIEEIELEVEKGKANDIAGQLKTLLPEGAGMDYWKGLIDKNLIVVPDDLFADLVLHGTEVVTRVRLTEEKTVASKALWTEEYLPADTVLYSVVGLETKRLGTAWDRKRGESTSEADGWVWVHDCIDAHRVAQFGGKETVGRGFLRMNLWPAAEAKNG